MKRERIFCSILNLFNCGDRLSLAMQLQTSFTIKQAVTTASHILLLSSDSILYIYSISSMPELLHQTNEFQHHSVKLYSIDSSFFIIDGDTSQLFQIDTNHSFEHRTVAHLNFTCRSLLSTTIVYQKKLFVLADDYSRLAVWNMQERTIELSPVGLKSGIKIREICALETFMVLYDDNQHKWFFYDVDTGKLNAPIGSKTYCCDAFCFTEDGQYLFGISQQESFLLMYRVNDGELVEKVFIENLLPHIQVCKDRLILSSNDELLLLCITSTDSPSFRSSIGPTQRCPLFENVDWLDCHKDQDWTATTSMCAFENGK